MRLTGDPVTYVLVPGAGGESAYWHRVVPLLRERGHDVVAPDLPADDDAAGLERYTDVVVEAVRTAGAAGGGRPLVVVAQSMGGFVAPLVATRLPVALLVLTAAMVPAPGETGGDWWSVTGQEEAARRAAEREGRAPSGDPHDVFLHDVPDAVAAALPPPRDQSARPFADPWPLPAWPDVPTRFVLGARDRLFPAPFLRGLARERLGIEPDELDCGHLVALAEPAGLVDLLERYRVEVLGGT
jgi:pimeloyl-ACP methyl ester carboxylesterase